jgi:hypothetical protein
MMTPPDSNYIRIDTRKDLVIRGVKPEAIASFDRWSTQMGFKGRLEAFLFVVRAMAGNRLAIMDRLTKDTLIGAATEATMNEVRSVTRHEVDVRLWELGFIDDPGAIK